MKVASFAPLVLLVCCGSAEAAPGEAVAPSPAGTPASIAVIERAAQQIQAGQATADPATRIRQMTEAQQLLADFLRDNPGHAEQAQAELWQGVAQTIQGKAELEAALAQTDAAQKAAQVEQARKSLQSAERNFSASTDRYSARLDAIPAFVEPDTPEHRRKEVLKGNVIQVRMFHAGVIEELAGSYPEGHPQGRQLYQTAADKYEALYRDYRLLIAGLMARLKQGQCYKNLGDTKRALGLFSDLLEQPSDLEPLRRLRVSAMYLSLEAWTSAQEKLYELALSQGEQFLLDQRNEERAWPEWQAVRYHTARGYLLAASGLPADRAAEKAEYLTHARGHAAALAEVDGPYRAAARSLVAQAEAAGAAKSP